MAASHSILLILNIHPLLLFCATFGTSVNQSKCSFNLVFNYVIVDIVRCRSVSHMLSFVIFS